MSSDKDKDIKKKLKDVNTYTVDELKELLGLMTENNAYTVDDIEKHFGLLSNKYPRLSKDGFLVKAKDRILKDLNMDPDAEPKTNAEPEDLKEWWSNQYLPSDNLLQNLKTTDRKNKVKTFDDKNGSHETMKREQLSVLNSHPLLIAQDSLNPTLKNINQRLVVIDSQYRQNIAPFSENTSAPSSSTDFTLDLSDPLTDTLSLKLYSYEIPYSWYVVDKNMGTSYFWVKYGTTVYSISVDDGNYTKAELVNAIQYKLNTLLNINAPFNGNPLDISYNPYNGKACFLFDKAPPATNINVEIIFYDTENYNSYYDNATVVNIPTGIQTGIGSSAMKVNNNLGWILGYRPGDDKTLPIVFSRDVRSSVNYQVITIPPTPYPYNIEKGLFSDGPIDTYGTRYLIVVLDDYNQNHLNNGLVNIVDTDTRLSVPDYFSADLPNVCAPDPTQGGTNAPFYVQSMPRKLTQAQLYSINQILDNKNTTYKYRTSGPTTTDVFAIIPLKKQGFDAGDTMVDLGSSLMYNTRIYFGPVNISRMRVSLQDDKGNTLNLNGGDWSITIMAETLYQY
jgi:hypothetical protein